jgi:hypothetical protein
MTDVLPHDRREAILVRVKEILETIFGEGHAFRNRLRIPDELLPAGVVLDGDETPDESAYGRGRPANGPVVCVMTPEIYAFCQNRADQVGTDVNVKRAAIIKAILSDATLIGLCKDGDIRYQGFATGFAYGRSLEGEMGLQFAFIYMLRPTQL